MTPAKIRQLEDSVDTQRKTLQKIVDTALRAEVDAVNMDRTGKKWMCYSRAIARIHELSRGKVVPQ